VSEELQARWIRAKELFAAALERATPQRDDAKVLLTSHAHSLDSSVSPTAARGP
jgi:hypothetical protein